MTDARVAGNPGVRPAKDREKCGGCLAIAPRVGGRVESRVLNIDKTTRRGPGMPRVNVFYAAPPMKLASLDPLG